MADMVIVVTGECGGVHGVCADKVEYLSDTAKFIASFQRSKKHKYTFQRITVEQFRSPETPAFCVCQKKKAKP